MNGAGDTSLLSGLLELCTLFVAARALHIVCRSSSAARCLSQLEPCTGLSTTPSKRRWKVRATRMLIMSRKLLVL